MCNTKKQAWDEAITRPPNAWSMPEELEPPKKRDPDLRPYSTVLQEHLNEVDRPGTETENHKLDVYLANDQHAYFKRFRENLAYIDDWKQYEQLELLKQRVDLGKVSIPYLHQFRHDLDLKV